eukprot:350547-Chlamydomonas_euryale.AAC.1
MLDAPIRGTASLPCFPTTPSRRPCTHLTLRLLRGLPISPAISPHIPATPSTPPHTYQSARPRAARTPDAAQGWPAAGSASAAHIPQQQGCALARRARPTATRAPRSCAAAAAARGPQPVHGDFC